MHKTPIPAVGWVLMWTREICDTKGFTKCLEIFQQVPWNCPLLSAPISTISCRPFSPARADKNVLFCMTLKESKLAGPHIAPASTIVFLLPVCEAGFCQCMNGGCSICQGWAKVWVGQSDSDKKKWFPSDELQKKLRLNRFSSWQSLPASSTQSSYRTAVTNMIFLWAQFDLQVNLITAAFMYILEV